MSIFEFIVSTLISTGLITALFSHWYNKKLRTHEIKIQKYIKLIEELAKLTGNEADWDQLRVLFNEALLFASDKVVGEILEFNKKLTKQKETVHNDSKFKMAAKDLQPLIVAIRKDLYLKSKSIIKSGLTFFQKQQSD